MCLTSIGLVLLLEIMKTLNEFLAMKIKIGPTSVSQVVTSEEDDSPLIHALRIPPSPEAIKKYR